MDPQASDACLSGRVALVTGVSRRQGIGRAVADRLSTLGATVVATGWRPHDAEMVWGAEPLVGGPEPGGYPVEGSGHRRGGWLPPLGRGAGGVTVTVPGRGRGVLAAG
jgi:NAD(P)-dependent dehydrogenase (short-subunit alcohol dehydrogenase family)